MKSRVYEYKDKLLLCKVCLRYGHSKNTCQKTQRCGKCSELNHARENCKSEIVACFYCNGDHPTGSYRCAEYKYREEIPAVQRKKNVSRSQAAAIVDRLQPQLKQMNYSRAVHSRKYKTNILKQTNSDCQKQESTAQERDMSETTEVDVGCVSPRSGSLVPTRVTLPRDTPGISDVEEGNSDTSTRLRKQAKEIYAEIFSQRQANGEDSKEAKEDRNKYERELKESRKRGKGQEEEQHRSTTRVREVSRDKSMKAQSASDKRTRSQPGERERL